MFTRNLLNDPRLVLPVDKDEVDWNAGQDDGDADAWSIKQLM